MKAIQFQFAFASERLRDAVRNSFIESYKDEWLGWFLDPCIQRIFLGDKHEKPFLLLIDCRTDGQINAVLETFYPTDDYPLVQMKNMPAKVLLETA